MHELICNCLLFQWVLGHNWGLRRSRVVIQHCSILGVWKSVLSSSCCSGYRVTLPYHDLCQVVLTAMVFVVFVDCTMHLVSASIIWQRFTGWFWFLLVRPFTFESTHLFEYVTSWVKGYCSLIFSGFHLISNCLNVFEVSMM